MTDRDLSHTPDRLIPIRTSQNKILRAIFGKSKKKKDSLEYTPSSPLYKELNVLKFQDLYYYNLSILVHDFYNSPLFPEAIHDKFKHQETNDRCLRSENLNLTYTVPHYINTYRKPSTAASIIWNKILIEIRKLNKHSFKAKLKKFFIDKY